MVQEDSTSIAYDLSQAGEALDKLQRFDTDDKVFVISAQDISLLEVVEYSREASAKEWKKRDWKENGRWLFSEDLETLLDLVEG